MKIDTKNVDIEEFNDYGLACCKYNQYLPSLFNRFKASVNMEGLYARESLFLIGGGHSLNTINFELLKKPGVMAMTINNSAVSLLNHYVTPQFSIFCDLPDHYCRQILLNPAIIKFAPFNLHGKPLFDNEGWKPLNLRLRDINNVFYFFRNTKFNAQGWFKEATVNWGSSKESGEDMRSTLLAAIKTAYILGFRNIYLIGVDFKMSKKNPYSFNEGRNQHMLLTNNRNYQIMAEKYLPDIKKYGEKEKFYIFNTNKDSNLQVFDYISLEDAVIKSTSKLGAVEKIQTKGMYLSYKQKTTLTREQACKVIENEGNLEDQS